jgi:hypothetical protein
MRRVGFEPTIPVFERVKIFRALDRVATVISKTVYCLETFIDYMCKNCYELWGVKRMGGMGKIK